MWKTGWALLRPHLYKQSQWGLGHVRRQGVSTAPGFAISPALINRAKTLEAEHALLSKQLLQNYDASIAKKAGSLLAIAESYKAWEAAQNVGFEYKSIHFTQATC